ncbi:STM2901 family protein [Caballeronia sp. LZ034LL]|uniref:STM2901 family protein n=1 Tax=Caballeronia sp. LZ034LL TaxID=3038567 RepID=UPI0028580858|nr:hypothetical protein [Caballeronia sp. LZ034LL]MDR5838688.1 hypothetical protein [Caballeronia sp. LZ034LL]
MSYEALVSDGDLSHTLYSYGDLHDLTKEEVYLCVLVEVICEHFDVVEVAAVFAVVLGAPMLGTRGKVNMAMPGTSLASVICRELLDIKIKKRLPTLIGYLPPRVSKTKHLGAFVGRWVPWLSVPVAAYDLVAIHVKTMLRYNALVQPRDRINDATTGTLG